MISAMEFLILKPHARNRVYITEYFTLPPTCKIFFSQIQLVGLCPIFLWIWILRRTEKSSTGMNPWVHFCMGAILCGRNPVWAQFRVGAIPCGRNSAWAQSRVGAIPCGRNSVWAQSRGRNSVWAQFHVGAIPGTQSHVGAIPYGRNPVWAQFRVGAITWAQFRVGEIPCGRNSMGAIPCGRNPVWAQSCVGAIQWAQSRVGAIPWAQSRVGAIPRPPVCLYWVEIFTVSLHIYSSGQGLSGHLVSQNHVHLKKEKSVWIISSFREC